MKGLKFSNDLNKHSKIISFLTSELEGSNHFCKGRDILPSMNIWYFPFRNNTSNSSIYLIFINIVMILHIPAWKELCDQMILMA